jgi:hypothetical protein
MLDFHEAFSSIRALPIFRAPILNQVHHVLTSTSFSSSLSLCFSVCSSDILLYFKSTESRACQLSFSPVLFSDCRSIYIFGCCGLLLYCLRRQTFRVLLHTQGSWINRLQSQSWPRSPSRVRVCISPRLAITLIRHIRLQRIPISDLRARECDTLKRAALLGDTPVSWLMLQGGERCTREKQ